MILKVSLSEIANLELASGKAGWFVSDVVSNRDFLLLGLNVIKSSASNCLFFYRRKVQKYCFIFSLTIILSLFHLLLM